MDKRWKKRNVITEEGKEDRKEVSKDGEKKEKDLNFMVVKTAGTWMDSCTYGLVTIVKIYITLFLFFHTFSNLKKLHIKLPIFPTCN